MEIYAALPPHANYCDRGEDYRCGDLLLPAGTRLDAAAVGVLASAGVTEVSVLRRPSVMVFSTGDEIVEPGVRPLPPGKIYGSNAALITARLKELGVAGAAGEQLPDQPEDVAGRYPPGGGAVRPHHHHRRGVSAGDKDIFHQVLPMLGADRRFWKVNLKPGTPAMYSLCGDTPGALSVGQSLCGRRHL